MDILIQIVHTEPLRRSVDLTAYVVQMTIRVRYGHIGRYVLKEAGIGAIKVLNSAGAGKKNSLSFKSSFAIESTGSK
jgi:hypothetical protein